MSVTKSPFLIESVRLFIAFRILFTARFYYPVFTIIFLDYGLTIEQFALLNSVWAITIFCSEVPSGALADILGRKRLVVTTSILMLLEISLIAFVPLGNSQVIFSVFLANRVLSGLAEAMASGADQALAYDALALEGQEKAWPQVLSMLMRLRSVATIISMTIGALIYDPNSVNKVLGWFGFSVHLEQQTTMRFPIYLTLILAVGALICSLKMKESKVDGAFNKGFNTKAALILTWHTGKWIANTPFVFAIILFGMCYDHMLRMITTMTSQYYRLIDMPEASFGLIGSSFAVIGIFTPKVAEYMVLKNTPVKNMYWLSAITILALFWLTAFTPYWGILPMAMIMIVMTLVSFFSSHYINSATASHQRATVLSFKGMAFNLAYGAIGFSFATLMAYQRELVSHENANLTASTMESMAFENAISWFPWYAIICILITSLYCRYRLKGCHNSNLERKE